MESLAKITEDLAQLAGSYALSHVKEIKVASKGGDYRNLVSNIDIDISNKLKAEISAKFPEDNFYSEEDISVIDENVRTWVVDPIDGTSNYVRSIPYYSSCVTVLKGKEVLACSVYSPVTNECFTLDNGQMTLNGEPTEISSVTGLKNAYVNFHPGRKAEIHKWVGVTQVALLNSAKKTMNLCSSALDLCYVACGRTEVLIYGTLSTLDVAGAVAMVRASGGEVYSYDTKDPVEFSDDPQRIIATANLQLLEDYFDKIS